MHKKTKTASLKEHIQRRKVMYAVIGTSAFAIYVQYKTAQQWNNFLKEEGLYDKYYNSEEI
jgi:hypothetical protein